MGLESIFQNAALTTFKVAGDMVKDVTYVSVVDNGLDDPTEVPITLGMLFGTFSLMEMGMNDNIQPGDVLGTILAPGFAAVPKDGDKVEHGEEVYKVKNYAKDPAGATYELHLRKI